MGGVPDPSDDAIIAALEQVGPRLRQLRLRRRLTLTDVAASTGIAGTPGRSAGARTRTSTGPASSTSAPSARKPGSALRAARCGSPPTAAARAPARAALAALQSE